MQRSKFAGKRIVYGPLGDVGYIAKKPGHGAATEALLKQRDIDRANLRLILERKRLARRADQKNEAEERFTVLSMRSAVDRAVNLGMEQADEELREKRNRLKVALLEEESTLMYEYTDKAQKAIEKMLENDRKKVEDILNKKTNADAEYVQTVRDKLALTSSEAYTKKISSESAKEAYEGNKAQIRAKELSKMMEIEEENYWNRLWENQCDSNGTSSALESEQRKQKIYKECLDRQIEMSQLARANENRIDTMEEIKLREIREKQFRKVDELEEDKEKRRQIHYEELGKQKELLSRLSSAKEKDDLKFEEMIVEDVHRKFERDRAKQVSDKERLRHELNTFQDVIKNYKELDKTENDKIEVFLQNEAKNMRIDKYLKAKCEESARRKRIAEMVSVNKRLAAEKLNKERKSVERDRLYHEFQARDIEILNQVDEMLVNEYRKNYDLQSTNLANEAFRKKIESQRQMQEQEEENARRAADEEQQARVLETLQKPMAYFTSVHPFYHLVRKV